MNNPFATEPKTWAEIRSLLELSDAISRDDKEAAADMRKRAVRALLGFAGEDAALVGKDGAR